MSLAHCHFVPTAFVNLQQGAKEINRKQVELATASLKEEDKNWN